jgi:hypothetical protein
LALLQLGQAIWAIHALNLVRLSMIRRATRT